MLNIVTYRTPCQLCQPNSSATMYPNQEEMSTVAYGAELARLPAPAPLTF